MEVRKTLKKLFVGHSDDGVCHFVLKGIKSRIESSNEEFFFTFMGWLVVALKRSYSVYDIIGTKLLHFIENNEIINFISLLN